jgi:hypothetical protein
MPGSASLFVDLTAPSSPPFAATSLIKHLIELIGADVCSFRRNTQVSYRFVDVARDLCDTINNLIKKVEDTDNWDDFLAYIDAIDPLEE